MRLRHIETLHAVMVAGTISGAARLLNITQPAATQALQHAELQLGYRLFRRVKNRLVPTQEALALYSEVDKLFVQLESVRRLSSSLARDPVAELRILIAPSLTGHLLPMALQRLRRRYKHTPISVRTEHSRDIAQAIALREADVGIAYGSHPHPAISETPVAVGRLVCVRERIKGQGTSIALAELANQPVIRLHHKDPLGFVLADAASRLGIEFTGGITVQTYQTALSLAEYGFGPALIDEFTAANARDGRLHRYDLEPEIPVHLVALRPTAAAEHAGCDHFVDCVKEAAAELLQAAGAPQAGG
ncbi:MAG TPA: LysR family transcriptional regulator [Ramlibacter sp.]|nr:LysR family transcriptional regulator [Ramlibacter sp.]